MIKLRIQIFCCVAGLGFCLAASSLYAQPQPAPDIHQAQDWLVTPQHQKADIIRSRDGREITLNNGLVRRSFRLSPNAACTDYSNLTTGQQLIRSVTPEARLVIDGTTYDVGGLSGQRQKAYLMPQWVDGFKATDSAFQLEGVDVDTLKPFLKWQAGKWWSGRNPSAGGQTLTFIFKSPLEALKGLRVKVHYDLYEGLPLMVKWLSLENNSGRSIKIDRVVNEILGMVEEESAVVGKPEMMKKPQGIYVETNYAFNNAMRYDISDQTIHWKTDSSYTAQVNYNYETPCVLEVYPDKAPGIFLLPGQVFSSVRSHELLMDSYDRERRGMAIRKMYRVIAPWTSENPIFMHLVSQTDEQVRSAIDQCAATGYEALILSFGSHLNMEDSSGANIRKWQSLTRYAHDKGIKIGGYSLFSSRRISDADDVISAVTGKPGGAFFGNAPCFGSQWGLEYRDKIKYFFGQTGFDIWENDGPYPGDLCASKTHPGHAGLEDSQWRQMEIQKELYHWLNARGVYINAPDWYFLDGTNKIGIGYREVNFSLPREEQMILNRQNIYDGTWDKTPSMGWGFVPLTRYQGGGEEAVLEPLSAHLADYKQLMMQYYGAGVQACYRGPRLYDTEATRQTVTGVIGWYKKYRDILNSDIIHLRRPDGRDWDGILHVNSLLPQKALMLLYNPTDAAINRTIKVPLYYAGFHAAVAIREKEGPVKKYILDRNYNVALKLSLPAKSYSWFVFE